MIPMLQKFEIDNMFKTLKFDFNDWLCENFKQVADYYIAKATVTNSFDNSIVKLYLDDENTKLAYDLYLKYIVYYDKPQLLKKSPSYYSYSEKKQQLNTDKALLWSIKFKKDFKNYLQSNINQVDEDGKSCLILAIINKQYDLTEILIQKRVSSIRDNNGHTALSYLLMSYDDTESERRIIQLLIKMKKEHDILVNKIDLSVLQYYQRVIAKNDFLSKLFQSNGYNVPYPKDQIAYNGLLDLCDKRDFELLEKTIQQDYIFPSQQHNIYCSENDSNILINKATQCGHVSATLIKLEGQLRDSRGRSALMCAVTKNDAEMCKQLLFQKGKQDYNGDTALIYAIKCDAMNAINILKEYDEENVCSTTSLIEAVRLKRKYYTFFLKHAGRKNTNGEYALQLAYDLKYYEAMEWIAMAEYQMKNDEQTTILMRAAQADNVEAARLLLAQAAQVDFEGRTAMMYAIYHDSMQVIDLLLPYENENITETTSSFIDAIKMQKVYIMKFSKYAGHQDNDGNTALNWCIEDLWNISYQLTELKQRNSWENQDEIKQLEQIEIQKRNRIDILIKFPLEQVNKNGETVLMRSVDLIIKLDLSQKFIHQVGAKSKDGKFALKGLLRTMDEDDELYWRDNEISKGGDELLHQLCTKEYNYEQEDGTTTLMMFVRSSYFCLFDFEDIRTFMKLKGRQNKRGFTALMYISEVVPTIYYYWFYRESRRISYDFERKLRAVISDLVDCECGMINSEKKCAADYLIDGILNDRCHDRTFNPESILDPIYYECNYIIFNERSILEPSTAAFEAMYYMNKNNIKLVAERMSPKDIRTAYENHVQWNSPLTIIDWLGCSNKKVFDSLRSGELIQHFREFKNNIVYQMLKQNVFGTVQDQGEKQKKFKLGSQDNIQIKTMCQKQIEDVFGRVVGQKKMKEYVNDWEKDREENE